MYRGLIEQLEAGATVVTATKRLARTLRSACDSRRLASGESVWPAADALPWSAWLRRLWAESRLRGGVAGTAVLLDDTACALAWHAAATEAEEQRGAEPPPYGLTQAARRGWSLALEWQAGAAPEWTAAGLSADQQALLRWSAAYRRRCADAGCVDSAELAGRLLADIRSGLFDDLGPHVFAGFADWTPAAEALRDALLHRNLPIQMAAERSAGARPVLVCSESAEQELRDAAVWARGLLERDPAATIGVIVPDLSARAGEVRRAFADVFAPDWRTGARLHQLPLNISYGRALADMPLVSLALTLFAVSRGRGDFDDLSVLLRSPWLAGGVAEAPQRALLEVELRDKVRTELALTDMAALAARRAPGFGRLVEALLGSARAPVRQTASEWAHHLSGLLQAAGWPGDAPPDSDSWQTMRAMNELLAAFAAGGAALGLLTRGEALACLHHLARERLFQPEGPDHAVQVLGWLEAAGHRFQHLWIAGMARELWPQAGRPNPFIPLKLQRRLGMPNSSAGLIFAQAGRALSRLAGSATEVHISWPARAEGEALTPSPLAARIAAGRAVAAPPHWANWNERAAGAGELELLQPDRPPPLRGNDIVRGGASVLNRQAVSPLDAFVEKRLGAVELQRPPVGIDARQRGILVHSALEAFYTELPSRSQAAALATDARGRIVRAALERALQALPGIRDPFMQLLAGREAENLQSRILEFIQLDLQRPAFTVLAREQSHEVTIGPLRLRLKLDRLDEWQDGGKMVIDYKTGQVRRQNWNPAAPRDLQLPMYVTAVVPDAAAVAFAQISVQAIGYDGVGLADQAGIAGLRSPASKGPARVSFQYPRTADVIESWDELRGAWADVLLQLAEEFAGGDFRYDPRNPDSARGQVAVLSRIFDAGPVLESDEG